MDVLFSTFSSCAKPKAGRILLPAPADAAGAFGAASRPASKASERLQKKVVDGRKTRSYMAIHRRGTAFSPLPSASLNDRYPGCPGKMGKETRRLFDIVGLDEGTCGRRPRSARTSGSRADRKKPSRSNVLLHIHSNMYLCRNGSQRCRPAGAGFPSCRLVGHKLESLILAQNERWRRG